MANEPHVQAHIDHMVDVIKPSIKSEAIEHAFRVVPRHKLIESFYLGGELIEVSADPRNETLALLYSDDALPTRQNEYGLPTSSTSMPSLMAQMLAALDVHPGMHVLEIGTGTGYNAALIAELTGDQKLVTTIDIQVDVVDQAWRLLNEIGYGDIEVRARDGFNGFAERAPYDRIIATVGCTDVSPHWIEQLAPGGIALIPLELAGWDPLVTVGVEGGVIRGRYAGWSGFMKVQGAMRDTTVLAGAVDARTRESVEHPLWEGFDPNERWAFRFFLGFREPYRFLSVTLRQDQQEFGLGEARGSWAAVTPAGLLATEDERALKDLTRIFEEWKDLGKPLPGDFAMEFVPVGNASRARPGEWTVRRRYFQQRLTLDR